MTKNQHTRKDGSIEQLLACAKQLDLFQAVQLTTNMALRADSSFSHIYAGATEKFLAQHGSLIQSNHALGKTLLLAGFGIPYKHGVQFRGMMSALSRNTPIEVLRQYAYDDSVRAELIIGYRNVALPSQKPEDAEYTLRDCSLAISHPTLRLKASGHYITQLAGLLNQPEVKELRAHAKNKKSLDLALIAFAGEFIKYEIATNRQMATCKTHDSIHGFNSEHIANTFAKTAPYIAKSAEMRDAPQIYEVIFREGRGFESSPEKAGNITYYLDALKTFVEQQKEQAPKRLWETKSVA